MKGALALLVLGMHLAVPEAVHARVERFAVLIGNDLGQPQDAPLRYASSDAARMYEVLRDLGAFEPFNMVLLRNENTTTVHRTLLSINERVREAVERPDTDVMLLVYYSGHADAQDLHLGNSKLPVHELAQMVRGSAAKFRLVVLDACRSGSLTRVKGGVVTDPFALPDDRLPGDGLAYLTSSAVNEDAQESDALRGSFFTHALVSGLLGAADQNGDGAVVLDEAYRYAYDATRRATSRTLAGTQHPSFRYDFRGSGDVVLTRPAAHWRERARVRVPAGIAFMIMREHAEGAVVGELSAEAVRRELSLRPGRYFIRGRGSDVLFEGTVSATAGEAVAVDVDAMERIEYAQLVRKGERRSGVAHGPEVGFRVRSALPNEDRACIGGLVGYAMQLEHFGARLRASICHGGFDNARVAAGSTAMDLELQMLRLWDPAWARDLALELGLAGGAALWSQRFDTRGDAPARQTVAPFLGIVAGVGVDLGAGVQLTAQAGAETHFMRVQTQEWREPESEVGFALRSTLQLAKYF